MQSGQKMILTVWRLRMCLVALPIPFLIALFFSLAPFWKLVLHGVWITAFLAMFLVYYPLKFYRMRYQLSAHCLTLRSGVFYDNLFSIEFKNIQSVAICATPFMRLFSLSTLVVSGAGSALRVQGLSLSDAESLSQALVERSTSTLPNNLPEQSL